MFQKMTDIIDFDNKIKQEWGNPTIFDGIVDLDNYLISTPKILWILKEGNEISTEDRNHREFHQNISIYKNWKSTYEKLILSTYSIMYNCDYSDLPDLNNDAKINNENVLLKIALINVNKNGGKSKSNRTNIEKNYTEHGKILIQQIMSINPDIIINGSRVERIFLDISKANLFNLETTELNGIQFSYSKEKLCINYFHPCCSRCTSGNIFSMEDYCTNLLNIYRKWSSI